MKYRVKRGWFYGDTMTRQLLSGMLLRRIWVRLTCWDTLPFLFRHPEIRVVQELGEHARKLRCDRCGKYFAMNDHVEAVLPWCEEMEDLYSNVLGHGRTVK